MEETNIDCKSLLTRCITFYSLQDSGCAASMLQVKKKWDNMKYKAKQRNTEIQRHITATGNLQKMPENFCLALQKSHKSS